jgi:CRP/FNR family transcriptional regulator, cyclic AMP receptor protein
MSCNPEILKGVPLFSLLDQDETAVLAAQVELKRFAARERIYKKGEKDGQAYVMLTGKVRVSTIDDDQQEVTVDEPNSGEFFGFASMLEQTAHQTTAIALEDTECLQISRDDIQALLVRKPHSGMDLLTSLGRQLHASQELVRTRASHNPNDLIEEESTFGDRVADRVARFGGSWRFIILFGVMMVVYSAANVLLGKQAWDPYPFILLNLFLSMLAALQAPVIMMSQNRQDTKDRLRGELDYDVNLRAASDIQGLSKKLNLLDEKMGDLETMVRRAVTP